VGSADAKRKRLPTLILSRALCAGTAAQAVYRYPNLRLLIIAILFFRVWQPDHNEAAIGDRLGGAKNEDW
jgi:hypothetical protein